MWPFLGESQLEVCVEGLIEIEALRFQAGIQAICQNLDKIVGNSCVNKRIEA